MLNKFKYALLAHLAISLLSVNLGLAQSTAPETQNDTFLSVTFNCQRFLDRLEQLRPEGATMSREDAVRMDMMRRLGLTSVELHVLHDPEDLFALAIAIYDPEKKVFNEMTATEAGKQIFETTPEGIRPKWENLNKNEEQKEAPPAQIQSILFKPMGQYLVGANPKLFKKIEADQWNVTNQVAYRMTSRVKTPTSLATVSISLPNQRSLDWLNKFKNQDELKGNLGASIMLGMLEGILKQVLEDLASTHALAFSIDLDENKRRLVRYSQYFKTAEAAGELHNVLNEKPASSSPDDKGAKVFANLLHSPGINKSLTLDQQFLLVTLDWAEAQDSLFQKSVQRQMKGAQPPPPPPPPAQSNPNKEEEKELDFAKQVEMSTPLEIVTKPFTIGEKQYQAEVFQIVGKEFLGRRSMELFHDVEVIGDKLYLAAGKGDIHAFNIVDATPPQLTIDTGFAEGGVLKTGQRIERLSSDHQGKLVTTVRFGDSLFIDAAGQMEKRGSTSGNLSMHPTEPWGISYDFNRIKKVDASEAELKMSDWTMTSDQPAGKNGKHFSFFSPVIIDADRIVVGCQVPSGERDVHNVAVFDYSGKEQFRFGNLEEVFELDGFCFLHDVASHANGFVTVDSNCRKIGFWSNTGEFLGGAKAGKALGVRYPWIPGCTIDSHGNLYVALAQERKKKDGVAADVDVVEGVIYRIKGL